MGYPLAFLSEGVKTNKLNKKGDKNHKDERHTFLSLEKGIQTNKLNKEKDTKNNVQNV